LINEIIEPLISGTEHSTFSKNRHDRFREAQTLRFVFEKVLQSCFDAGLLGAFFLPGHNRSSSELR